MKTQNYAENGAQNVNCKRSLVNEEEHSFRLTQGWATLWASRATIETI